MKPQTFQHPEIRDENDNIIQPGAFGKNTPFCTKGNDGILDYVANDLEYLYKQGAADNKDFKAKSLAVSGTSDLNLVNADTVKAKSLAVSGTSEAPTAPTGDSSKTIANTEFVQNAVSGLVDAAPETLNTLNELVTALGNDPNFATTVSNQIGKKANQTDLETVSTKVDKGLKARATGIVNKKFLGNIGFTTPHIGTVIAEIIGYTEEGHRRVRFTVQCACTEPGTNATEFKWLNLYSSSIGIATAYLDKYPQSKFIKHESLVYPMIYCDMLTKEEKGYGAYIELSDGFVHLSRMYTGDGKIGMYPNSILRTGNCMFAFISDFTNE